MLDLFPSDTKQGAEVHRSYLQTRQQVRHWLHSGRKPVLVHQMGKVGSSSVMKSIAAQPGLPTPMQTHFLSEKLLNVIQSHIDAGMLPLPVHLYHSWHLRRRPGFGPGAAFKVISLVRDPIARQISNVFQNPGFFSGLTDAGTGEIDPDRASALINARLREPDFFDDVFNWFDNEVRDVFGVDVLRSPFNQDAGFSVLGTGATEILLIQLEQLEGCGREAISRFLNLAQPLALMSRNRRSRSDAADTYRTVLEQVRIQDEILDRIYAHAFVRHFYSPEQIEEFRRRWSAG
jgi:hypothetical protein